MHVAPSSPRTHTTTAPRPHTTHTTPATTTPATTTPATTTPAITATTTTAAPATPTAATTTPAGAPTTTAPVTDTFARTSGSPARADRASGTASLPAADPALVSELSARRAAHTDVYRPVVADGPSGGLSSLRGVTSTSSAADQLDAAARPAGRLDTSMGGTRAEVDTVRDGLRSARTEMRDGNYSAAADRLHALREDHAGGFYGNERVGLAGYNAAGTLENQARFCARMEDRLHRDVSCPPTEREVTDYFGSFNNDADRARARTEFTDYSRAFYTHAGNVGARDSDITYSRDATAYVAGGRIYDRERDAPDGARAVTTSVPDRWSDVSGGRMGALSAGDGSHTGRQVIDCEGYAYLSDRCMRAAGYEVTHVTAGDRSITGGDPRALHAMTELRDPTSGETFAHSNGAEYSSAYSGYMATRSEAERRSLSSDVVTFRGDTMRESQLLACDPDAGRPTRRRITLD